MFLIVLGLLIVAGWAYFMLVRPALIKRYPDFFAKLIPFEQHLFEQSRTVLAARLVWLSGLLVTLHDTLAGAGLDWTPVVQEFTNTVPESYRALVVGLVIAGVGATFEWLRHATTGSLADKKE